MTTITAGASGSVTLAQGGTLKTAGTGTAVLGPGPQANMQIGLQGANAIGPFPRDQVIYLTATTQIEYSVNADPAGLSVARFDADGSGSAARIAAQDGRAIQFPDRVNLPKWRAALAKMRAGVRNARLVILGSSTPAGYGAQDAGGVARRSLGQVPKLVALLDKYYAPAYDGSTFGSGQFSPAAAFMTFDSRVNLGAGWDIASTLTNLTGHYFKSGAQNALLTFTPGQAFNKAVIWARRGPTSADFKIAICKTSDGTEMATLNVSTQALDGMYSYAVGGGALTPDLYDVRVTQTNALTAGVTAFGLETYDSNKTGIQVLQWGRGGITAASFLQSGNAGSPQDCIAKMGADLAFVALGSNYWNAGVPIEQMVSEMQQLITSLKNAGTDVILEGPHKTAGATPIAVQQGYIDALAKLAYNNGLLFVDMWSYFGEYADAITNGLAPTNPDNTHVGSAGHSLYSQVKLNTVMRL